MFADTHCHLLNEYYEDKSKIIKNAIENQVDKIIVSGYDDKSNQEIIEDVKIYKKLYGTLGIHPNNCYDVTANSLEIIKNNLNEDKIVAVGEIGLDYHYEGFDKEKQKELFEDQLKIAQDYNLPVVIHSRDATKDVISILKKYKLRGIIHSFSDDLNTALEYISMGFILGINGTITFKNSKLLDIVKEIGIENIVLETDAPYLTPFPYRGTKNESKNIIFIAKYISENLGMSLEKISDLTNKNISNVFDI